MSDLARRLASLTPEQRAALEARLKERAGGAAPKQTAPIEPRPPGDPARVSFPQERLWFLDQLEGPSATYNVCEAFRLKGPIDAQVLDRALVEMVRRHESLRSTFAAPNPDEPPVQVVAEPPASLLEIADVSAVDGDRREDEMQRHADAIAAQPMDLARGPLMRVLLISASNSDHALVVVMHHIISDGWSLDIFFRELATAYVDCLNGRPVTLPPLDIQYSDFAHWQRHHAQDGSLQQDLDYWRTRLTGAPALLELPTDAPRPLEQSYEGGSADRVIGPDLTRRLDALSRQTGTTMFMIALAAFKVLLFRYTRQPDIVVGSPVANRGRPEFEPLIGFFVNMLVLRTELSDELTFREALSRVRTTTLEAVSHQRVSFERLVQELHPRRSRSFSPFFQVALMFQPQGTPVFPGVTVEPYTAQTSASRFDLTLFVTETAGELRLSLEYASRLFTPETAARLNRHFERVLEEIAANPDQPIGSVDLLSSEEQAVIVSKWNDTAREFPRQQTVHGLFEEQVAKTPERVAVRSGNSALTYAELNARSTTLARRLRAAGVRRGDLVGLYVERSVEMVVGVLGIMKTGAAYVPMDPAFPAERLGFMVEDAAMPVIVTQSALQEFLPPHQARIVTVDDDAPEPSGAVDLDEAGPGDIAYTIFTSGSTGRPKGVQIPHRAVVNFLRSMGREPGISHFDVLVSVTTLSFDIAGLELFLPLTTGALVVVASRETAMDGVLLKDELRQRGATVLQATPATFRVLLEAGWAGDPRLKILCGGEPLPKDLAARLIPICHELWNMYGPTETTIWSTCSRVVDPSDIHIGRPIDNTQVYVVGDGMRLQPVGVAGELLIGGDGVALGYLKRAELTAEKFVPDPFSGRPGARLYRTGDLARWRRDGTLDCLGRMDQQVKIRGFRIELGEIEAVLSHHPQVKQAAVAVRDDGRGGSRLVAYVVTHESGEVDPTELRNSLRSLLPEYMVPNVVVRLDQLPLTPNGKIDRKALPEPEVQGAVAVERVAPRNDTERRLAAIFSETVGARTVGVDDSFFDLGGHSLLAVRLMAHIEREFGTRLPLATLFSAPTVANLARQLTARADAAWSTLVPINVIEDAPALFMVHGAGGNVLLYRELARVLAPHVSTYGFQSRGLDRRSKPHESVEEMAAHYVGELREFQPSGPYHLGGYCMGGAVAYEMARLLREEGEQVGMVAMLDSYNLSRVPSTKGHGFSVWRQNMVFHLDNMRKVGVRDLSSYLVEKVRMADEAARGRIKAGVAKIKQLVNRNGSASVIDYIQEVNDRAIWSFSPQPSDGPVTLFKPQKNYDFMQDPQMGWGDRVPGGPEIVEVAVNPHAMLIEPFVKELGRELLARIHSSLSMRRGQESLSRDV
jgi:amino acid adenylation domain-containing protein